MRIDHACQVSESATFRGLNVNEVQCCICGSLWADMADLKYEKTPVLPHGELVREIDSGDPERIAAALYSATRHDEDWRWVQEQCLRHLAYSAVRVRWAAATCLGDLAFSLHRPIDHVRVLTALYEAANDPAIAEPAHFSISLIKQRFKPQ